MGSLGTDPSASLGTAKISVEINDPTDAGVVISTVPSFYLVGANSRRLMENNRLFTN